MPNDIKKNGEEGLALQVTKPARSAGLVEENEDGEATRLAPVRLYAFNNLLLVFDLEKMDVQDIGEIVSSATRDSKSIYRARDAAVSTAGNGYQVQLPIARDAGFELDDTAACQPGPGMLVIHRRDRDQARLAEDLLSIRQAQKTRVS
jgi:hypothetical protein